MAPFHQSIRDVLFRLLNLDWQTKARFIDLVFPGRNLTDFCIHTKQLIFGNFRLFHSGAGNLYLKLCQAHRVIIGQSKAMQPLAKLDLGSPGPRRITRLLSINQQLAYILRQSGFQKFVRCHIKQTDFLQILADFDLQCLGIDRANRARDLFAIIQHYFVGLHCRGNNASHQPDQPRDCSAPPSPIFHL